MRVAMLSVHSSPLARLGGKEAGGMNVYVRELSRELGRRGVNVDIFTRSQDPALPTMMPLAPNVRVVNLHTGPQAPYDKNWVLTYLPEFVSRVRCFADGQDLTYDLIHSHYWLSGEAALSLRRSWRVPVLQMFHTLGAMKNSVARGAEEAETAQRILIEQRLLREVDQVVAATPLDRAQMVWHYGAEPSRITVIPCGVDIRHFRPQPQHDARAALDLPPAPTRVLLFVGRIEPLKGLDALIAALDLLFARQPELRGQLRLLVVGGEAEAQPERWNSEQRRLAALRAQLGLQDTVSFLGARSQEDLPLYYAAADALCMPSHYESFGMVALEALACGTPVIASRVGGLTFSIEDGVSGLLHPHDDPPAIAAQIEVLLSNEPRRTAMGVAARRRAQRYAWSSIGDEIEGLYQGLLASSRRSRAMISAD